MNVQKLFERYNRRFWEGKLAGWTVSEVHCSDGGPRGDLGHTDNEAQEIFIQIGLPSAERRDTLLHEMCHAATPSDLCHGDLWQKEMLRIDKLGARGMAKERTLASSPR